MREAWRTRVLAPSSPTCTLRWAIANPARERQSTQHSCRLPVTVMITTFTSVCATIITAIGYGRRRRSRRRRRRRRKEARKEGRKEGRKERIKEGIWCLTPSQQVWLYQVEKKNTNKITIIKIIDSFCIALFSGVPKFTAPYNILQHFLSFTNIIHIIMTTKNI